MNYEFLVIFNLTLGVKTPQKSVKTPLKTASEDPEIRTFSKVRGALPPGPPTRGAAP